MVSASSFFERMEAPKSSWSCAEAVLLDSNETGGATASDGGADVSADMESKCFV